jgi:hypothetical protein
MRPVSTPALLILCAVAGCTSIVRPAAVPSGAVPSKAYVTGSRLPVPADRRTGLPAADPSLQVVTHEQIELTGRTDLGAALRQLVPAIQ